MIKKITLQDNWEFLNNDDIRARYHSVYGVGDNRAIYIGSDEKIKIGRRAYKVEILKNSTQFRIGSFLTADEIDSLINDGWKVVIK